MQPHVTYCCGGVGLLGFLHYERKREGDSFSAEQTAKVWRIWNLSILRKPVTLTVIFKIAHNVPDSSLCLQVKILPNHRRMQKSLALGISFALEILLGLLKESSLFWVQSRNPALLITEWAGIFTVWTYFYKVQENFLAEHFTKADQSNKSQNNISTTLYKIYFVVVF